jgi:hypothetical protein
MEEEKLNLEEKKCPQTGFQTHNLKGCYMIKATPPVVMSDLGGFKVCGIRNAPPFVNAVRVKSADSKECSDPTFLLCNPTASAENIVCVQDLNQCGITDIKAFQNQSELNDFLLQLPEDQEYVQA